MVSKVPRSEIFSDPQLLKSPFLPAKKSPGDFFSHSTLERFEAAGGPPLGSQVGLVPRKTSESPSCLKMELGCFLLGDKGPGNVLPPPPKPHSSCPGLREEGDLITTPH